ncbi:MAG: gliding motility-associated C-terminal domain-containing protein [Flavobacteriales bacterium]|nr:gliding motility-associated C-terminal domain-containing protein [Flavobacteriales bacterium]HPF89642.1 PKD domain-containing protein [Flavobacteriales bacterium]
MDDRRRHSTKTSWWLLLGALCLVDLCSAQCTTTISSFPYDESFESGPIWTAGGVNNDWEWGTPAHPTVNSAAQGLYAWCVGGLTGSFYSNGQQSWLESPCFDISGLTYPWLSFSIWWETERNYDGIGLQYSLNGGTTWINLGGSTVPSDCHTMNWFNSANITALNLASPRSGWSGTSTTGGCASGGGSGGYVTASFCLLDAQSIDPVKFRFIFGAGTICNTFDGVAIDAIHIGEAPPLSADFTYTCAGNAVNFSATGNVGCVEQGTWNFGDPSSGAANTATGASVAHSYPGPGNYTATFTMAGSCGAPVVVQQNVVIAGLSFDVVDVSCTPNSGSVTVNVDGGLGPFTYDWDPGGANTAVVNGLAPGEYTVLVQAPDMCPLQGSVVVGEDGANLSATATVTDATCAGSDDGTASVAVSGGTGSYTFAWAPSGGSAAVATALAPGPYTCTVADEAGCSTEVEVEIEEPAAVVVDPVPDSGICAGESTILSATASGGTGALIFNWQPAGPAVAPGVTTTYTVSATDANGCTSDVVQTVVNVSALAEPMITWDIDRGCGPLCVNFVDVTGAAASRAWSFTDGTNAGDLVTVEHCFNESGGQGVSLTLTSADGCVSTLTLEDIITVLPTPDAAFRVTPEVAVLGAPMTFARSVSSDELAMWSFGDPTDSMDTGARVSFTYPDIGCYTVRLEVSNADGCTNSSEGLACVEDAFALYAPNAFTPNGDGFNDLFVIRTTVADPRAYSLTIFDRWGREVFASGDALRGWDGGLLPGGVYAWLVRMRDREGDVQLRQGHVTLVR